MRNLMNVSIVSMVILIMSNCSDKFKRVPDDKFIGLWRIEGRQMFEEMQINIKKENNHLVGRIYKLNNNKLIKMFSEINDIWISDIVRTSNFEFKLTEKRVAKDLFALYGQSTSQEFKVQFIDDDTFGLSVENSDPTSSKIRYKKLNDERINAAP